MICFKVKLILQLRNIMLGRGEPELIFKFHNNKRTLLSMYRKSLIFSLITKTLVLVILMQI